ncbi:MAG: hypothetical protein WDZ69_01185 [Candidatus Pacearchaeota archaeon]
MKKEAAKEKIKKKNSVRGKKSRAAGARFEARVRAKAEDMGWIVSKWMNTVEQEKDGGIWKLTATRPKFVFNPKIKRMVPLGIGTGFPDFVCFRRDENGKYDVVGLEVKANGYLDKVERAMCTWLIESKIFSQILIAKKGKKRGEIEYVDFEEKYNHNKL